jgi:hypothetical protein
LNTRLRVPKRGVPCARVLNFSIVVGLV